MSELEVEIVETVERDASLPVEMVSTVWMDAMLGLRDVEDMMVEQASAIVLLIIILRAQNVMVVLAMDRFVNESLGCPFGPGVELGASERIIIGVGQ